MQKVINRTNAKVLGTLIKMNRIRQNMSQKALSEGICVNSYLSRIENGEILPSEEVMHDLFHALAIEYRDDEAFLEKGRRDFQEFLDELMFNEFDQSHRIFKALECDEIMYIHSPLIIDYYIVKLAYYCTQARDIFNETKNLLHSVNELMTSEQKFKYYMYVGIDTLKVGKDNRLALKLFEEAMHYGENGQMYNWLGVAHLAWHKPVQAFGYFKEALARYTQEGNLTSVIGAFEYMGLTCYETNEYQTGLSYYHKARHYALKIKKAYATTHIDNQIAWGHFRLGQYVMAKEWVVDERYNTDNSINSSLIKLLLAYYTKSEKDLCALQAEFKHRNKSLHRMLSDLLHQSPILDAKGMFNCEEGALRDIYEMASVTHSELKKVFVEVLVDYYKAHRKYKEATELCEQSMRMYLERVMDPIV